MNIARSRNEVDDLLNTVSDHINDGESKFPGMSYEEGVQAGIEWVIGDREDNPMED